MMFRRLSLVVFILLFGNCDFNKDSRKSEDAYHYFIEDNCKEMRERGKYFGKPCIKAKEALSCFKVIDEIRSFGLEKFLFGKKWHDPLFKELEYKIGTDGIVEIKEFGPSEYVFEYENKSKFFKKGNHLFYHQPAEENERPLDELNIEIKYVGCRTESLNAEDGIFLELLLSDGVEKKGNYKPKERINNQANYLQLYIPEVLKDFEVDHTVSIDLTD